MTMICYIGLYAEADGFLETEQLSEAFLTFYEELKKKTPSINGRRGLQEAVEVLESSRSRLETKLLCCQSDHQLDFKHE
jgi:hypothetical protein